MGNSPASGKSPKYLRLLCHPPATPHLTSFLHSCRAKKLAIKCTFWVRYIAGGTEVWANEKFCLAWGVPFVGMNLHERKKFKIMHLTHFLGQEQCWGCLDIIGGRSLPRNGWGSQDDDLIDEGMGSIGSQAAKVVPKMAECLHMPFAIYQHASSSTRLLKCVHVKFFCSTSEMFSMKC
eukprot:1146158-Pelagomonas_calceolata.AAC.2